MITKPEKDQCESMKIEVSFPESVHIDLVQANDLRHYEIFLWLGTLFASAATGFWVSLATTSFNKVLLAASITFSVFTLIFGIVAYKYRSKIAGSKLKKVLSLENFNSIK